jgi:serine/threonine protein kinase
VRDFANSVYGACKVGLEHAHRLSIAHTDVRPANILVYRTGDQEVIKVADWGLAIMDDVDRRMKIRRTSEALLFAADAVVQAYLEDNYSPEYIEGYDLEALGYVCYTITISSPPLRFPKGWNFANALVKREEERLKDPNSFLF